MRTCAALVVLACGSLAQDAENARPQLIYPNGLAFDRQGNLYISDIGAHQVFKASKDGRLSVVAGTGEPGFSGDGGPAAAAQLFSPHDLTFDSQGNLLIADSLNHRIRRIDSKGVITTVAGTGTAGLTGDGGPATAAQLNGPQAIVFDRSGNALVADSYNHVVRRIDASGTITTVIGTEPGLKGDGGQATAAMISLPTDVAIAADGTIYVSEGGNSRVRQVTPDGKIQTITGFGPGSGLGGAGFVGDDGPAERAKLFAPSALQIGPEGRLFICDSGNNRIRVLQDGIIKTIAGNGETGLAGDGGDAKAAQFNTPQKIRFGPDGRLFVADRGNGRVRAIDSEGVIRTVAGEGEPRGITVSSVARP